MNPQQHYEAAEELLRRADAALDAEATRLIAAAQVHATLATAPVRVDVPPEPYGAAKFIGGRP